MSTHNICFCGKIRKLSIVFRTALSDAIQFDKALCYTSINSI